MLKKEITKRQAELACCAILLLGLVMKLLYAWQVPYNISTHDLGEVSDWNEIMYGHLGYVQYVFQYHKLPGTDVWPIWQYYHPPLFYIVGALVFQIVLPEMSVEGAIQAFEILQYVNMVFAFIATVYLYRILKKLSLKPLWLIALTAFLTWQPCFYFIGAGLNNDCLMTMFCMMAVYYTICWIQNRGMKDICLIAITIASAMLSKTSGGLIAVGIGFVFLYVLVETLLKKDWRNLKTLIIQFMVFGIICVPLGLFWVVRNYILCDMPFNFVHRQEITSIQYVGDCTFWQRMGLPTGEQLFAYAIDFYNSKAFANIWGQIAITMSFDEGILVFYRLITKLAAILLLWSNMIAFLLMNVLLIKMLLTKGIRAEYKILSGVGHFTLLGSFIQFAFEYPHVCTMNFRYIVCTLVFLGMAAGMERSAQEKPNQILNCAIVLLLAGVSGLSSVLYFLGAS